MRIVVDDLKGPEIAALLQAHLDAMHEHSPADSVHALDLDRLRQPDITFWTAWDGSALMGCGALKALDAGHGEIKSMRTDARYLRKGVAAAILETILSVARSRGYSRLSHETGRPAPFQPAHRLYERYGFRECPPFADYVLDDFSICMTLDLSAQR
jgi:putative acetyltransferase